MDTKSLKKQLGAAIAMVLVAAVALGSSTYAWFATNNTVNATTTTISAQSNAAFMTINNSGTSAVNGGKTAVTTTVNETQLYPATYGEQSGSTKGTWMTGYGSDLSKTELKSGTLVNCKGTSGSEGSAEAATSGGFALLQSYNISANIGQSLSALKVSEVTAVTTNTTDTGSTTTESSLKTALRILVTNSDGTAWAVYGLNAAGSAYEVKLSSAANTSTDVVYAGTISSDSNTAVHVYLYYEGSDINVTTKNLVDRKLTATNAVTVTFTATPNNK